MDLPRRTSMEKAQSIRDRKDRFLGSLLSLALLHALQLQRITYPQGR